MVDIVGIDLAGANCAVVHQDRLVLAGSQVISDLLLASRQGELTNFVLASGPVPTDDAGNVIPPGLPEVLSTDGFWFEQASGRQNTFHAMLQQQGLFILGDLGESSVPAGAFTSGEAQIRENSAYGSEVGRPAIIASGLVIFIQEGGNDVRGLNWSEQESKYVAPSLLRYAGSIVRDAVDMTSVPSQGRRSDLVYVVLGDGTMAVMTLKASEAVNAFAWSRWETTGGRILAAAAPLRQQVFAVERDGEIALETLDEGAWERPPQEGEEEFAQAGDRVSAGGRPVPYDRRLKTLPFVAPSRSGSRRGVQRSRMLRMEIDLVFGHEVTRVPGFDIRVGEERALIQRQQAKSLSGPARTIIGYSVGSQGGWRKRLGVELTFGFHVEIAGLSYLASG